MVLFWIPLRKKEKREKLFDKSRLDGISYDNSVPIDESGNEIGFRNKRRNLNSKQYKKQAEGRKKTAVDTGYPDILGKIIQEKDLFDM